MLVYYRRTPDWPVSKTSRVSLQDLAEVTGYSLTTAKRFHEGVARTRAFTRQGSQVQVCLVRGRSPGKVYTQESPHMDTRSASTRFRQLHQGPTPLLIPNAWDAGSARVIEGAGAQAIATTSAGLS